MNPQGHSVLIIDDDELLLDIYKTKFEEKDIKVHVAKGGNEALSALKDGDFDIILLDIVMPEMDGLEFLKQMREKKLAPNATVVILSNQGQESDIKKAEQYDVDGYIVKASTIPSEVLNKALEIRESK